MSDNRPMPTTEQRDASHPAKSVWVGANAGSGKTHVLITRVVRLLLAGAAPQSVLCLTFTKAAAAEMSVRLFRLLSGWITLPDKALLDALAQIGVERAGRQDLERARRLFALVIEAPGGLKIQTIHAFCERLLQLFPAEAGLAPGFAVMDEDSQKEVLEAAYNDALAALADKDSAGVMALLEEGAISNRMTLETLIATFLSGAAPYRWLLDEAISLDKIEALLRAELSLAAEDMGQALVSEIAGIDQVRLKESVEVFATVKPYGNTLDVGLELRKCLGGDAEERRDAWLRLAFTKQFEPRAAIYAVVMRKLHAPLCDWLDLVRERICAAYARDALHAKLVSTMLLLRLMREVEARYTRAKGAKGIYDFDDLINRTRLLLSDSSAAQWVLYKLDAGLSHILVDEAQDTSPAQWEIVQRLAEEFFSGQGRERAFERTLFAVGDIKQSIYSFQGADTEAFARSREHFRRLIEGAGKDFNPVSLIPSYRSVPEVLRAVDAVFAEDAGVAAAMGIGANEGTIHAPTRRGTNDKGRFELWPIMQPDERPEPDPWLAAVDQEGHASHRQKLARFIADKIAGWIGKRKLVGRGREVRAGDILILFQTRGRLFQQVIAALREKGVPVAGADRLKLRQSIAIHDLCALAQVALIPQDDHALACVLKSPLVPLAIDDTALTALAAGRGPTALWDRLSPQDGNAMFLASCQARARETGPYDFFAAVLAQARQRIAERLGPEALDATDVFLDQAMAFEREQGTSLASFLNWFQLRDAEERRDLDQAGGQVRLMTVHGAKGLEADIVILADATEIAAARRHEQVLRIDSREGHVLPLFDAPADVKPEALVIWKEREKARQLQESKRLLYVAMTRARDELYVCGAATPEKKSGQVKLHEQCWYAVIDDALGKAKDFALRDIEIVHPYGKARRFGEDDIWLATPQDEKSAATEVPAWAVRAVMSSAAESPGTATGLARSGEQGTYARRAAERGIAIHRYLEHLHGLSPEEAEARALRLGVAKALAAKLHALVHETRLAPFFGPEARAEARLVGRLDGIGEVEGQVDRLSVTDGAVWLIDYKSGRRENENAREAHLRQMAQYAAILSAAYPGRGVRAALLWTQSGELEWLDWRVLSQALDRLKAELRAATA